MDRARIDIRASAGDSASGLLGRCGVADSCFERMQNAYDYYWEEERMRGRLEKKMTTIFHSSTVRPPILDQQPNGGIQRRGESEGGSRLPPRLGLIRFR